MLFRWQLSKNRQIFRTLDAAVNAQGDEMDPQEILAHIEALAREGLRVSTVNPPQS